MEPQAEAGHDLTTLQAPHSRSSVPTETPDVAALFRSDALPDRAMRRLLGITEPRRGSIMGAHRAFRSSLVISGIRCLITYLLVPILVPILSLTAWVAAPIGVVLCVFAAVNGIISVRRFWVSDHKHRWMYTWFMALVFVVLAVALTTDIMRLAAL